MNDELMAAAGITGEPEGKSLDLIGEVSAAEVYASPESVDAVLIEISERARSIVVDVTSAAGRKQCASLALKVARSKTYLDALGKDLVAELKAKAGVVDAQRRKVRDTLDELKAEVRAPLTEIENREANRVKAHEERLAIIESAASDERLTTYTLDELRGVVSWLEARIPGPEWEEFLPRAKAAHEHAYMLVVDRISEIEREEQIRLQNLAVLEEIRLKQEREAEAARIERERQIAERARAEESARLEREHQEREAQLVREQQEREERIQRQHKAELARQEAAAKQAAAIAEQRVLEAAAREREALAEEQRRLEARLAEQEHARKIEQRYVSEPEQEHARKIEQGTVKQVPPTLETDAQLGMRLAYDLMSCDRGTPEKVARHNEAVRGLRELFTRLVLQETEAHG
jgi:hypothetical protein